MREERKEEEEEEEEISCVCSPCSYSLALPPPTSECGCRVSVFSPSSRAFYSSIYSSLFLSPSSSHLEDEINDEGEREGGGGASEGSDDRPEGGREEGKERRTTYDALERDFRRRRKSEKAALSRVQTLDT